MVDGRPRTDRTAARPALEGSGGIGRLAAAAPIFVPMACLSFAVGALLDVIGTGAPLALRAGGLPLAAMGFLQVIYLPYGISFLWAPLLDRIRLPKLGQRTGWVIYPFGAAAIGLVVLANAVASHHSFVVLIVVALGISVLANTAELSSQALVVETLPPDGRAAMVTTRLIAASAGASFGVAIVTGLPHLTLPSAFITTALLTAALAASMLFFPERRSPMRSAGVASTGPVVQRREPAEPASGDDGNARHRRRLGLRVILLGFYCVPSIMLGSTPGLALLDYGASLPIVGLISGPLTSVLTIAVMLASSTLLARVRLSRQIAAFTLAVSISAIVLIAAALARSPLLGAIGAMCEIACDAGFNVPVAKLMYRWSEGARVATGYAVLSGATFLVSFPARLFSPALASAIGWPAFFSVGLVLYAAAGLCLARVDRQEPAGG